MLCKAVQHCPKGAGFSDGGLVISLCAIETPVVIDVAQVFVLTQLRSKVVLARRACTWSEYTADHELQLLKLESQLKCKGREC